ncbi:MAG: LacI family DNA-binding transcriptional regulator [Planctomycetes bacterium]|nr:LacI family DNA-binding transcriptional regulator [Planctomycetota bacterium]
MYELERGRHKSRSVYLQIADGVSGMIAAEGLREGDRLPSMEELARRFGVNKLTVIKALRELQRHGKVYSVPVRGTFVGKVPATVDTVGVVSLVMVPGATGYYHLTLLDALREALAASRTSLLHLPVRGLNEGEILAIARDCGAQAFLIVGWCPDELLAQFSKEFPGRVGLLDYSATGVALDAAVQDNAAGMTAAMAALCPPGKAARVAVIAGPADQQVSVERYQGVEAAAKANPRLSIVRAEGSFSFASGQAAMEQLLERKEKFDGVVCMNDEMALGAMAAARGHGLEAPGDFWLLGYDDIPAAQAVGLSTVAAPVADMGRAAVEQLQRRLAAPGAPCLRQSFTPWPVWRATAPAPR